MQKMTGGCMILNYSVTCEDNGKTVLHILKRRMNISSKLIKKLKYGDKIFKNNSFVRTIDSVVTGDCVRVEIEFEEESPNVIPQEMNLDIIYEDNGIIVLNKQPGIIVHPTSTQPDNTLANALMHHYIKSGITTRVRPVSRLDRDTTGIIIFAKNQFIQTSLIKQMKENVFKKHYLGIVHSVFDKDTGSINLPIARKPDSIIERIVSDNGSPSVTHYRVLEKFGNASLLEFELETGRTHQIRVHCREINHPLIGDTLYGMSEPDLIGRQALHSYKVEFVHPETGSDLILFAPLPVDMEILLSTLRKGYNI